MQLETTLGRIASRPDLATCDVQERWVVQERLAIAQEYRIHSFEEEVLPNLSGER